MPRRLGAAVALTLALQGCSGVSLPRVPAYPDGPHCLNLLAGRGIVFDRIEAPRTERGCGISTAVSLRASTAALNQPVRLGCSLALALNEFELRVAQPAAQRRFGQPVVRLHHLGGYSCRGRSGNAGRLSEHALGRAIDIAAFELADGTIIRVEQDWRGGGAKTRFLREVARGACGVFSVVLGPDYDAAHRDHLHFDIGPWPLCGA